MTKIKQEEVKGTNKYARKADKSDADKATGEAVGKKGGMKRGASIVAVRHSRVIDRVAANIGKGRKPDLYNAMIAEGYSPEYARSGGIKFKKTWDQLLTERLGDDKLSNVHQQLLVAKKLDYMLFNHEISDDIIYELLESVGCVPKKIIHGVQGTHAYYFAPDNKVRKDALELAAKIRGKMAPETIKLEQTGLRSLSDADLARLIVESKKKFLKKD
jgi:hypothetical protein